MRAVRSLIAATSGSIVVEFALIAPVLLAMIFGVVEFGRLFWARNSLQYAAEETGRYAMTNTGATPAQLVTYARNRIDGLDPDAVTVTATPETLSGVNYVTIAANFDFEFLIDLVDYGPIAIEGRSRVPRNS